MYSAVKGRDSKRFNFDVSEQQKMQRYSDNTWTPQPCELVKAGTVTAFNPNMPKVRPIILKATWTRHGLSWLMNEI